MSSDLVMLLGTLYVDVVVTTPGLSDSGLLCLLGLGWVSCGVLSLTGVVPLLLLVLEVML